MAEWWMYLVLGVVAGVVSASLGLGAGVVMVPALVLLFSFEQRPAQGVALCVMVPMALVGAWRYIDDPSIRVDLRVAALIAASAVVGAYFGHKIASRLPADTLRKAFAVLMFVVAIKMFFTKPRVQEPQSSRPATSTAAATEQSTERESR